MARRRPGRPGPGREARDEPRRDLDPQERAREAHPDRRPAPRPPLRRRGRTPSRSWSRGPAREAWKDFGLLQAFQRAQKKAGVAGWRVHDLRHFFATSLFRGGAAGPAVQQLLGYADLTTTARYSHLGQVDLEAAIAGLG